MVAPIAFVEPPSQLYPDDKDEPRGVDGAVSGAPAPGFVIPASIRGIRIARKSGVAPKSCVARELCIASRRTSVHGPAVETQVRVGSKVAVHSWPRVRSRAPIQCLPAVRA